MPWNEKDLKGEGGEFEYTISIRHARAGYTDYNEGKTCLLILEGEKEYPNGKLEDGHMWIAVPSNQEGTFEPADKEGTRFLHSSGDEEKRFSPQSKIQKFIMSAVDAGVPLQDRLEDSLDAKGWAGLKLRIKEVPQSATVKGESRSWNQPMVVEYLGEVGGAAPSSSPATASGNGSGDKREAALALAKECPTRVDYMEKASAELGLAIGHEYMSKEFYEAARA